MGKHTDKLAQITGFSMYQGISYGSLNDIFFNASISDMNGLCTVSCFIKRDTGTNLAGINAFLETKRKKYKNAKAVYNGSVVTITIPNFLKLSAQLVAEFLHEVSAYLHENNYYSAGCNLCGSTDNLGFTFYNGLITEICSDCHNSLSTEMAGLKEERETSGSVLSGTIGAILGGILGIIPWVLLGLIGFVASISGLIMGYLAQKGYTLFGGKRNRTMLLVIAVVLIVFTYVAVIINQTIVDYRYLVGEGYTGISALSLFKLELGFPFAADPDIGYLWGQLALGWLFAGLGNFSLLRDVYKTGAGRDLEAKRIENLDNQGDRS